MNHAKTPQSSPTRPGTRSTSRRQHGTARSVPVLFSLPTVQPSTDAHEGLPADAASTSATITAPISNTSARAHASPAVVAPALAASGPAASGHLLNDSPATQYPAVLESPTIAGEPVAGPTSQPAPAVPPAARNWTSTFTNAAICVLVLALCALILRNSTQTPSTDTASRGKPVDSGSSASVPALTVPTAAPPAIRSNESTGRATANTALDTQATPGDSFATPANTSPIPGAAVSSKPAVHARLTETSETSQTPSSTATPLALPQMSVPSLLPANSATDPSSKSFNATQPTAPSLAPTTSRPTAAPAQQRPSMPAQGQAWDSSNLPSQPRRPASGAAMVPESIDPIEGPKPQRGHDALESLHPQTAQTESTHREDAIHADPADAHVLDAMDRVVHALAQSTSADSDVIPASFTASASSPELVHANAKGFVPAANATMASSMESPVVPAVNKLAEPVALNTRDIIQLRQSQRRGRETAWVSTPATGVMSKPVTAPAPFVNNATSTAMPATPAAPGPRPRYTPVLTSAEGVPPTAIGDQAAQPSKSYLPVGSDWNLSMLDAADGPANMPSAPLNPPASASNGSTPATPRSAPYTPVSPKLPDPF